MRKSQPSKKANKSPARRNRRKSNGQLHSKEPVKPTTLATLNVRTGPPKARKGSSQRSISAKKAPRTWICIHIPTKMRGRSASQTHPGKIETGKVNLIPERLKGDRVWLVGKSKKDESYALYGHFIVDSVDKGTSDGNASTPKLIVSGAEYVRFKHPLPLDAFPWFRRYAVVSRGLSHGFQSIRDPEILSALDGLLGFLAT